MAGVHSRARVHAWLTAKESLLSKEDAVASGFRFQLTDQDFFAGGDALDPVRHRYRGVLRAVEESDGVTVERVDTIGVTVHDGREVADELLRRPDAERPDGILAGADLLALGLVQTLAVDRRLRVPEDVAVVGYDNNRAAWDSVVPITTLDQAGEEMGRAATTLLLEEIQEPDGHQHRTVWMEPFLVPRESSVRR